MLINKYVRYIEPRSVYFFSGVTKYKQSRIYLMRDKVQGMVDLELNQMRMLVDGR